MHNKWMSWGNQTTVTEFVLLGLSETWEVKVLLFVFFLLLYMATLYNNILILSAIISDHRLFDSPMFFLIGHLAFLDLCMSSFATPRYLFDFLAQRQAISFQDCMAQIFFLHLFGGSEMLLLTAMAYDRYVAICHPLHYVSLMSRCHCIGLVLASWAGGFIHTSVQLGFMINVPFCGPNRVDNYFCDLPLVIKLGCIDTYPLEVMMVTNSGIMSLVSFIALLLSYALLLSTICSRGPSEGTSKAASTCTSHLIVVTMYFGPCLFIYLRPYTRFMIDKVFSVFSISITPFLNPTVYALKNKEMKAAIRRLLARRSGQVSTHGRPGASGKSIK
ncbi:olfactory receptor 4K14-like [Rhineura floridana]|uniref:olfactory receptor 4K14-like n=1 Tax=Rhineura floridana TaxID=261503 RepID=UPI002AC8698A|nr:olfactory receptor 4K14-like [Rhineura floridana]XP_061444734.1 olfactory receptor 4K14-like [Rhineura floridana]